MELPAINLLPYDGEAWYTQALLPAEMATKFFNILQKEIPWKPDEVYIFGKKIITKRLVAWYADGGRSYTYSKSTKQALPWLPQLLAIKQRVQRCTGADYNSCLLNLYPTGNESMGWHSDDEKDLQSNGSIAAVSLGAERKFMFKNKTTKDTITHVLCAGSLLDMKGSIQAHWQHRLPPAKRILQPRISLTFRQLNTPL